MPLSVVLNRHILLLAMLIREAETRFTGIGKAKKSGAGLDFKPQAPSGRILTLDPGAYKEPYHVAHERDLTPPTFHKWLRGEGSW